MSIRWSPASQQRLDTVDPQLQQVVEATRDIVDMTIVTGHRGEHEQELAVQQGRSQVHWPHGKHNAFPSKAVDIQPYPYPTTNAALREQLSYIAGIMVAMGHKLGVTIRWGGDWDSDGELSDNTFDDLFHFEVVE